MYVNGRNLPERENENVKNEVNEMLREGLKLCDVTAESAERQIVVMI